MKPLLIAALVAAQLSTTPAFGASLEDHSSAAASRSGAFAGARFRVAFGGTESGKARAGLTLAPVTRSSTIDGAARLRFAEGVEYGFRGGERAQLSIAGQPVQKRKLGAQEAEEDDDDGGIPTWVLIAGGVVVAAGIGLAIFIDALNDSSE